MSVLAEILAAKRREVAALRAEPGESALLAAARAADAPRGFVRALCAGAAPRVIAEHKRASPSKGPIRPGSQPAEIAKQYAEAGAAALSILTDRAYFDGSLDDLVAARGAVSIPVLRKDFVVDPLQIVEARAHGADAILLIVAALDDAMLREGLAAATELGMDALVEVHTAAELERARALDAELVGINNRDLTSFVTDVGVTRALLPLCAGMTIVSESGLDSADTLRELADAGVHAFLIGESLMRAPDPGAALRGMRGGSTPGGRA
jgi:indole-3-glycerol phosphate synthase